MSDFSIKRRKSSPPHLPDELVFYNILSRLAVEPLLRFSCVSKLWCTTVADPDFVASHFRHSLSKPLILGLFQDGNRTTQHFVFDFDRIININGNFEAGGLMDIEKLSRLSILGVYGTYRTERTFIGGSNGLICFYVKRLPSQYIANLEICNPSTREMLVIPIPLPSYVGATAEAHYGFGYDPLKNEYKVVYLSSYCKRKHVMVYTLGTNSWRFLEIPSNMTYQFLGVGPPVFSDGALHWFASCGSVGTWKILSFDIHSEKLLMIPYPIPMSDSVFQNSNLHRQFYFDCDPMFDVQGSLCVARSHFDAIKLSVFHLDHKNHNWEVETIGLPLGDATDFSRRENGAIVLFDKVLLYWTSQQVLTLYDLNAQRKKEVKLFPNLSNLRCHILNHVQNLVSLKTFVPPGKSEVAYVSSGAQLEGKAPR